MNTEYFSPPKEILPKDFQLGDRIKIKVGSGTMEPFGGTIITRIADGSAELFRPYATTADFSNGDAVIPVHWSRNLRSAAGQWGGVYAVRAPRAEMNFVKPMLAHNAEERSIKLGDRRYAAEPKIDGKRGQIHLEKGKAVAVFSREGTNLLNSHGLRWLKDYPWHKQVKSAILDCELYSGTGTSMEGPAAATAQASGDLKVSIIDVMMLNGESFLRTTPYKQRRLVLDRFFSHLAIPWTTNHKKLWNEWVVKMNGEGIVLKSHDGLYVPGKRSFSWLKLKVLKTVDVVITGVTYKPTYSHEYSGGQAALTFGFYSKKTKQFVTTGQGSNGLPRGKEEHLKQYLGRVAELVCNGIDDNGHMRHHRFKGRWRDDKKPTECTMEIKG